MHIFGKGAGSRGGDGGERSQQSLISYPDRRERAKIDARHESRVRRALQCDLATVLLTKKCFRMGYFGEIVLHEIT